MNNDQAPELLPSNIRWQRVNDEPFEYAIQQGRFGDEFVKLLDGTCLRRPTPAERSVPQVREALEACREFLVGMTKPATVGVMSISSYHPCQALIDKIDAALTARPSDAPVSSTAAEMLVLADEFEGEAKAHGAMGDKDERTKCLRAAYALRHLALPPDESAHVIDDSVEKACAAYLADVPLDGRHSDAAGGNAYEIVAWAQEELAHFRSQLEPARVTPSGGQPEIHSSDGGVETQTHHGAAAAPITNVKAGVASGPSEQECGGVFVGGGVMYPDSNDPHDWAKAFCGRLGMWRRTEYGNTVDIGDQVGIMERWFTAAMSRGAKP